MRYRKLSQDAVIADTFVPGGDMTFGRSLSDFYVDQPEAVAQAAMTRLRLEEGEWFLDLSEGTPWKTQVLGKGTLDTRDPVIKFRVLGTPGVNELISYFSSLDPNTREFAVDIRINTVFGDVTYTTRPPIDRSQLAPSAGTFHSLDFSTGFNSQYFGFIL